MVPKAGLEPARLGKRRERKVKGERGKGKSKGVKKRGQEEGSTIEIRKGVYH